MSKKATSIVVVALLIVIALALGAKYSDKIPGANKNSQKYMAVTLDNGLIYFGNLKNKTSQYVTLENAYFAQQNAEWVKPEDRKKDQEYNQPQYLLTKVGDTEVYGPDSTMKINRDHILLIQDLKSDSQVIKTINSQK
ncbi:hypothetical protein COT79_00090 [Candidatus Berkelbacteria bacterium CG10_big_fil_rev_8_21_14_0_10_43_14]|uniref:Uncharacterized protein n=1 Tax=Candidatus Berkelbacteria bacterium CG10_big_fil_rev_8_21_14_0_10_43_14 TaxID=1974515 RepID=A0A2M6R9T5_9BACT|nr:MAG: hypothetical protein COT79_00090 [Candidatus Berkelbacteria bacterium CG10_big_fil_rev_8_21_14_0_10_43_14]